MKSRILLLFSCLLIISTSSVAFAVGETELLNQASKELAEKKANATEVRQQLTLGNAATALSAAQQALADGNEEDAIKNKKKALRWAVQAVRECTEPGEAPDKIGEALVEEGGMTPSALNRFNDLLDDLVAAKKSKKDSGDPFAEGMAINQIMLALDRLITDGFDGWHPNKAIKWYLNAAAGCEDVQDMINRLLEYLNSHADDSGIPDLMDDGYAKAKEMLDDLYAKKRAGAPSDEIIDLVNKIKEFLDDEGSRTGRARKKKFAEMDKEEEEAEKTDKRIAPGPAPPTTVVTFTALQGRTTVNQQFVGEIETVKFVAYDGKELDRKEVAPDIDDHGDHTTITIGKATKLASIVLTGAGGTLHLLSGGGGSVAAPKGISPADGLIETRNGILNETLAVPEKASDILRSPQEHMVSFDGQNVSTVAVREGEIGVTGQGITPSALGSANIQVTSPSGEVFKGSGTVWGYDVTMPEVTRTNVWVPVMVQVYGLDPQVPVTIRFIPQPGQQITPETVTIPAAEAMLPMPAAKIMAEQPGPQSLNVTITAD